MLNETVYELVNFTVTGLVEHAYAGTPMWIIFFAIIGFMATANFALRNSVKLGYYVILYPLAFIKFLHDKYKGDLG